MENLGKEFRARFMGLQKTSEPAPFWKRLVAFILDLIVLEFIVFGPFATLFESFASGLSVDTLSATVIPDNIMTAIIYMSVMALLYFALMQRACQQTVGMMLMKIYVEPQIGFFRAILRNLFILPIFPFSLLWIIEPIYLIIYKRRLLEKLTGTVTVEVQDG